MRLPGDEEHDVEREEEEERDATHSVCDCNEVAELVPDEACNTNGTVCLLCNPGLVVRHHAGGHEVGLDLDVAHKILTRGGGGGEKRRSWQPRGFLLMETR